MSTQFYCYDHEENLIGSSHEKDYRRVVQTVMSSHKFVKMIGSTSECKSEEVVLGSSVRVHPAKCTCKSKGWNNEDPRTGAWVRSFGNAAAQKGWFCVGAKYRGERNANRVWYLVHPSEFGRLHTIFEELCVCPSMKRNRGMIIALHPELVEQIQEYREGMRDRDLYMLPCDTKYADVPSDYQEKNEVKDDSEVGFTVHSLYNGKKGAISDKYPQLKGWSVVTTIERVTPEARTAGYTKAACNAPLGKCNYRKTPRPEWEHEYETAIRETLEETGCIRVTPEVIDAGRAKCTDTLYFDSITKYPNKLFSMMLTAKECKVVKERDTIDLIPVS